MTLKRKPLPFRTSLKRQMTVTFSAVIIVLVVLIGLPMLIISLQMQQQVSSQTQQEIADKAAQNLARIIEGLQTNQLQLLLTDVQNSDLEFVANELSTFITLSISRLSAQVHETIRAEESLADLFGLNSQIQAIQQFGADGSPQQVLWRNDDLGVRAFRPNETSLNLTRQGLSTQDAFFFDADNTPVMIVAIPVIQADQQVDGLILAWISLPTIWSFLTDLPVGENGYLYLIDQDNELVGYPNRFAQTARSPFSKGLIDSTRTYHGLNGQNVIGKVAPIENTSWRVVIEIPQAEAQQSLRALLIILGAILSFGIAMALFLANLFSRMLLQPINILQQSATRITAGDLAHRIELDRQDELGFLAGAFNQMVSTLEKTINELRTVSLNLFSAQEQERRRIAQEIHDELGQTLTALRLNLWMSLQTDPKNQNMITAHQQATAIQEQARSLSHELRPAMLDDMGLLPTLEWYIDRVEQRANVAITLDAQFNEANFSPTIQTALYRLIVEALTNTTKHAQASVIEIGLKENGDILQLQVSDDGVGFDPAILSQAQSLGIRGMQERVSLLQGHFLIQSKVGEGTMLTITLPIRTQNDDTNRIS